VAAEIESLGHFQESFKNDGGDEFMHVVYNVRGETIKKAYERVERVIENAEEKVQVFVKKEGLENIVHPKHLNNKEKWGTGVICTHTPILLDKDMDYTTSIEKIKRITDNNLEVKKNLFSRK